MNSIPGVIESIVVSDQLSQVHIRAGEILLTSLSLDTPESAGFLKVGANVSAVFNETEVVIATDDNLPISLRNRLKGTIISIEKGKILSKLSLQTDVGIVGSIITSKSVVQLELEVGGTAVAMIKTNEIIISA
jgi:molybdate transport system regulatory protein